MATELTVAILLAAQNLASGPIRQVQADLEGLGTSSSVTAGVFGAFALAASAVAVALGAATTEAAKFQTTMNQVQQNTGLTAAETTKMSAEVLNMSNTFGVATDKIAEGYAHVMNITHDAAAAQGIMNVSLQSSVATGADVAQVANVLTNAMHEYGLDTSNAGTETQRLADINANAAHVMGIMHIAAQDANMTLSQFADTTGRAVGVAAGLKIPLEDIGAADAALTKHGFDAAGAGTQVTDMLIHMVKPTVEATAELERMSKLTGIDLVGDFSTAGLASKGLVGVLDDLHAAYLKAGLSESDFAGETFKLVQAQRGGLGVNALLTTGYADLHGILADVSDQTRVNTVTEQGWIDTQKTAGEQWNILTQSINNAGIELGTKFLPILTPVLAALSAALPLALKAAGDAFNAAADATRPLRDAIADLWTHAIAELGELKSAVQLLFNGYFPEALDQATRAIATFGGYLIDHLARWSVSFETWVLDAIPGLMQNLGNLLGAVGDWISGKAASDISAKLPTWISAFTDWAKEVYGPLEAKLADMLGQLGGWITGYAAPFLWNKVKEWGRAFVGWIVPLIPPMLAEAGQLLVSLGGWIKNTALPVIWGQVQEWGSAFWGWVAPMIPPLLAEAGKLVGALFSWIGSQVQNLAFQLGAWTGTFLTAIGNVALGVPGKLGDLKDAIASWVSGGGATAALKAGEDLAGSIVQGFGDFLTKSIPTLVGNIGNLVGAAIQALLGGFGQAAGNFGAGYGSTANGGSAPGRGYDPSSMQMGGGEGGSASSAFGGPLAEGGTGAGGSGGGAIVDIIREAAIRHGIDPDVALRVAMSEGGTTEGARPGDKGSSFGPFQLHYGNVAAGGNAVSGLGDTFTAQTGLDARNPANVAAAVEFAMTQAAQSGWGAWHGAPLAGVTPWMGIGTGTTGTSAGSGVGLHDTVASGQPVRQADGTYQNAPGGANYVAPDAGASTTADAAGTKAAAAISKKWASLLEETSDGMAKIQVREDKQFGEAQTKLGPEGTDVKKARSDAADKIADLTTQKDTARRIAADELVYTRGLQDQATAHARQIEDANIIVNQKLADTALVHTRQLQDDQAVHYEQLQQQATVHQRQLQDAQVLVAEQIANTQLVHQRALENAAVPVNEQLAAQATVHSRTLQDTEVQYQYQRSLSKATTDAQRQQIQQAHQDELENIAHQRQLQDAENVYQRGLQIAATVAQRGLQDAEIQYQNGQKAQQMVAQRALADTESAYQLGLTAKELVYQRGLQDKEVQYQRGIAAEALTRTRADQDTAQAYARRLEDEAIEHRHGLEDAAFVLQVQKIKDEMAARIAAIAVEFEARKKAILDDAQAAREAFKTQQDEKADALLQQMIDLGAKTDPIVAKMKADWASVDTQFAAATKDINGNQKLIQANAEATGTAATDAGVDFTQAASDISKALGITDSDVEKFALKWHTDWDTARKILNDVTSGVDTLADAIAALKDKTVTVTTDYVSNGQAGGLTAGGNQGLNMTRSSGGSISGGSTDQFSTYAGRQAFRDANPGAIVDASGAYFPPGHAAGGPMQPGELALVGEKGPELFRAGSSGGYVFPNGSGPASNSGPPIDYDKLAAALVAAMQNVNLSVGVDTIHSALLQKARRSGTLGLN